jgi:DNA mismatch repair protein MutS2
MPGLSNALAIARNLGMSTEILDNASNYLEEKDKHFLELIKGLEQGQIEVAEKKNEITKLRDKASLHENSIESLLKTIKAKKTKLLSEYETRFKQYLKDAESKLEKIVNEAKKKEQSASKEAQRAIREVKKEWRAHLPSPSEGKKPIEKLKAGQHVKLLNFNQEGVVQKVDLNLKKAEILVGEIKIKTSFDTIEYIKEVHEDKTSSPPKKPPKKDLPTHIILEEEVSQKINVIGMTVDEAIPIVDRTIDHALIRGLENIEIIHGLGTGRLKEAIRKHLNDHSYVKGFGSDEQSRGGAGVTLVQIQFTPKQIL